VETSIVKPQEIISLILALNELRWRNCGDKIPY